MTLRERQLEYYNQLNDLITSGIYDDRPDFTVILQPHLRDQTVPKYVSSYHTIIRIVLYLYIYIAPLEMHTNIIY